jgi:hypothetical protein
MMAMLALLLLVVLLGLGLGLEEKPYIIRVESENGSPLRTSADPLSQIIGSIAQGSMIAAYEELDLGNGVMAYRVGELEGWVMEGVVVVGQPDPEVASEEAVAVPKAAPVAEEMGEEEKDEKKEEDEVEETVKPVQVASTPDATPAAVHVGGGVVPEQGAVTPEGTVAATEGSSLRFLLTHHFTVFSAAFDRVLKLVGKVMGMAKALLGLKCTV